MKIPKFSEINKFKYNGLKMLLDLEGKAVIEDAQAKLYLIYCHSDKKYVYHREDGPAFEYMHDIFLEEWGNSYYLYGNLIKEKDFLYQIKYKETYNYQL